LVASIADRLAPSIAARSRDSLIAPFFAVGFFGFAISIRECCVAVEVTNALTDKMLHAAVCQSGRLDVFFRPPRTPGKRQFGSRFFP
jgi:hypothetical protein